jgi:DNA polymerase I-like protein with 3'-5' exonuclease and polymerase domains
VYLGSAADVCKVAMLATEQAQQEHSPPLNARLLLQIHDELVWQVPDSQLEQFKGIYCGCNQSLYNIKIEWFNSLQLWLLLSFALFP